MSPKRGEDRPARTDRLDRRDISAEAREPMLQIADRCPVHRTLHGSVRMVTRQARRPPARGSRIPGGWR